ncbi:MAG: hypothetical protein H6978_09335 [Gammaproteobacteria bacterium]|nr:hypothetical protein [Gammaproteobacteria bacterium]
MGALPAQTLAAGDCGLFLWPRQRNAELGFFVSAMSGNGRISWGGHLRELSRMATDGNEHFGIHDRESFVGEGIEMSVRIVPDLSRPVANGVLVANASMRVTDDSGASVVIPAAGLVACED